MFGYININKDELKVKEFEHYCGYYCGLCECLKERYGRDGQLALNYDMTFLVLLFTALYERDTKETKHRCLVHPTLRHTFLRNEFTQYAADMTVLLTYPKYIDDWKDEKKRGKLVLAKLLKKDYHRIVKEYPRQGRAVKAYMRKISRLEKSEIGEGPGAADAAAGATGKMLAEIFVYREDEWEQQLRAMGFYLGKFIYLMDAYEDVEQDEKQGSYNPLSVYYKTLSAQEFDSRVREMLLMMAAEAARTFEGLPILEECGIIRNILYSGIWQKYQGIQKKRMEKIGETDDGSI